MQSSFRPCLHVSGFVCIRRHFIAVTNIYASTRIRICCVFDCPHVGMVNREKDGVGVRSQKLMFKNDIITRIQYVVPTLWRQSL